MFSLRAQNLRLMGGGGGGGEMIIIFGVIFFYVYLSMIQTYDNLK